MSKSLCCYSGGKSRIAPVIVERITQYCTDAYREPFLGAGSVGIHLMTTTAISKAWLNDIDPGIYCMWMAAAHHSDLLKAAVRKFVPSVSEFYRIKSQFQAGIMVLTVPQEIVRVGVEKLAVRQMSFSGLGQMAGGPLGGWSQLNDGVSSRWNAEKTCRKIDLLSPLFRRANITNLDFSDLLEEDTRSTLYLDPLYWNVGNGPYQHSMSEVDHFRLRNLLRHSDHDWWLSYNDVPEVRALYSFASIERIDATYSTSKRRTHELLISLPNRNRTVVGFNPAALAA
jgi:DNA adenine methylase